MHEKAVLISTDNLPLIANEFGNPEWAWSRYLMPLLEDTTKKHYVIMTYVPELEPTPITWVVTDEETLSKLFDFDATKIDSEFVEIVSK